MNEDNSTHLSPLEAILTSCDDSDTNSERYKGGVD